MKLFFYYFKIFIFILFFVFFCKTAVFAEEEYSTSFDIVYTVNEIGNSHVQQTIKLKNNLDNIYIQEYSIVIGSNQIKNITASDNFGSLDPKVDVQNNSTSIDLTFGEKLVGKDKQREVLLSFDTVDFATVKGQILEVGFPLFANKENLSEYNVRFSVPASFGEITQMNPQADSFSQSNGYYHYGFSKGTLLNNTSISATFGTEQIYDFSLRYTIENTLDSKGKTEIALPADTNYQKVLYSQIEPAPQNVYVDEDGNWLAEYLLSAKSFLQVTAKGQAKIYLQPLDKFQTELSSGQIQNLIKADQYWQVNDPEVVKLAQELKTPKNIYDYLVKNFIYDYGRLQTNTERFGAVKALQNPESAICMEFTDAFIALSRAAGIPAREHNGYAYTQNSTLRPLSFSQDVLHAWPEYYDSQKKQWLQVDPTWGNTTGGLNFFDKFDLDHFTFITHGNESTYPITVGSYRTDFTKGKDIEVAFGQTFDPVKKTQLELQFLESGIVGLPVNGTLKLKNIGNSAIYDEKLSIVFIKNKETILTEEKTIDILPPFANWEIPINYNTDLFEQSGIYQLQIQFMDQKVEKSFNLKSYLGFLGKKKTERVVSQWTGNEQAYVLQLGDKNSFNFFDLMNKKDEVINILFIILGFLIAILMNRILLKKFAKKTINEEKIDLLLQKNGKTDKIENSHSL
ncbi:transglutaminase domain-containing protein [Candidatus Beckwithbacteria bacterium]|nr:transglutaminase domain-containing protein [Candidatus Beckwithbacteria bacterium]